jgi:hypothetical protein
MLINLLPQKALSVRGGPCHGKKCIREDQCSTAVIYEKFPPLVLGRCAKPRCLKNLWILPCKYDVPEVMLPKGRFSSSSIMSYCPNTVESRFKVFPHLVFIF